MNRSLSVRYTPMNKDVPIVKRVLTHGLSLFSDFFKVLLPNIFEMTKPIKLLPLGYLFRATRSGHWWLNPDTHLIYFFLFFDGIGGCHLRSSHRQSAAIEPTTIGRHCFSWNQQSKATKPLRYLCHGFSRSRATDSFLSIFMWGCCKKKYIENKPILLDY